MAIPGKNRSFLQGTFTPQNPKKFIGGMNGAKTAVYRSSWELRLMASMDSSNTFIRWGSEIIRVPYINPLDKKEHQYYIDFYFECKDATTGKIRKFWAECKPFSETIAPKMPKTKTAKAMENYKQKCITFVINQAKWTFAKKAAEAHGASFFVITEKNSTFLNR